MRKEPENAYLPLSGPTPTPIDVFNTISIIGDTEGRPVGEQRIDPSVLQLLKTSSDIPFVSAPSNFPDSPSRFPDGRPHPLPLEESALEQTRNHFTELLASMSYIKRYVRRKTGDVEETEPLSVINAFATTQMGRAATFYLLARRDRPLRLGTTVPATLSVMFKALSGVSLALRAHITVNGRVDDMHKPTYTSADELLEFVEKHNLLIGGDFVCAAPTAMIRRTLTVLLDSSPFEYDLNLVPIEVRNPKDLDRISDVAVALTLYETASFAFEDGLKAIKAVANELDRKYANSEITAEEVIEQKRRLSEERLDLGRAFVAGFQSIAPILSRGLKRDIASDEDVASVIQAFS